MSGEILADGNSPMMMTVDQYNERVARSWALATEAERERIIKLVERFGFNEELGFSFEQAKEDLLALIKGEK